MHHHASLEAIIKRHYRKLLEIEFDPDKDAANLAKHRLSLADAGLFDMANAFVAVDDREEYGEVRFRAWGRVDGEARCLVFTYAGTIRAISYRRAHEKEMRRYGL